LKEITNYYESAQKEPSIIVENTEKQPAPVDESPMINPRKETPEQKADFAEEAIPLI